MVGKINYKKIETQIRSALETIRKGEVRQIILVSTLGSFDDERREREKETIELTRLAILRDVKEWLNNLPKNYHAFPELNQMYDELK